MPKGSAASVETSDCSNVANPSFHLGVHDLCEAALSYVLAEVNTVQYMLQAIEEITGEPFQRQRLKCLPSVPDTYKSVKPNGKKADGAEDKRILHGQHVYAGYLWRRARPDSNKGDVVLIEEHVEQYATRERKAKEKTPAAPSSKASPAAAAKQDDNTSDPQGAAKTDVPPPPATKQAATPTPAPAEEPPTPKISLFYNPATPLPPKLKADLEKNQSQLLSFVERNVRHELVHAFDDCRGKIEPVDCMQQACSEIRAARLSGDCFSGEELKKGRFNMAQGGLACVQRRARMALETNPVCRGFSERAVENVFDKCYSDYEPFAAPVYAMGSYGDVRFPNSTWSTYEEKKK